MTAAAYGFVLAVRGYCVICCDTNIPRNLRFGLIFKCFAILRGATRPDRKPRTAREPTAPPGGALNESRPRAQDRHLPSGLEDFLGRNTGGQDPAASRRAYFIRVSGRRRSDLGPRCPCSVCPLGGPDRSPGEAYF